MKTLKTALLQSTLMFAILLFSFSFSYSYGQGCHGGGGGSNTNTGSTTQYKEDHNGNQYASHGGKVERLGKYFVEMVDQTAQTYGLLVFYLMNKKGKPLGNQGITGKAEITFSDQGTTTLMLEPIKENGFAGQMMRKSGHFICFLTLKIKDENFTARFDGNAREMGNVQATEKNNTSDDNLKKDTVIFTCPMHPEIQSDKSGTCPKCGMDLVKKTNASGDQEHKHEMGMMCPMHGLGDMNKSKEKKKIPVMAIGMGIMMGIMMAAMIVYVF